MLPVPARGATFRCSEEAAAALLTTGLLWLFFSAFKMLTLPTHRVYIKQPLYCLKRPFKFQAFKSVSTLASFSHSSVMEYLNLFPVTSLG